MQNNTFALLLSDSSISKKKNSFQKHEKRRIQKTHIAGHTE
jgi:hypothetical protein